MRCSAAAALVLLAAVTSFAQHQSTDGLQQEKDHKLALDHYEKGRDAMSSERFQEAVEEFKAAIQLDPLLTLAHYRKGQAHMALKEYAQAEHAFIACRPKRSTRPHWTTLMYRVRISCCGFILSCQLCLAKKALQRVPNGSNAFIVLNRPRRGRGGTPSTARR
jgi:tetratricopeptide (TPR) repeat protein